LRQLISYQLYNQRGLHAYYDCYNKGIKIPTNFFQTNPPCTRCAIVIQRQLTSAEKTNYSNGLTLLCNDCMGAPILASTNARSTQPLEVVVYSLGNESRTSGVPNQELSHDEVLEFLQNLKN
jgi:hypothetical protein